MTKKELLKLLEPLDDSTPIMHHVCIDDENMFEHIDNCDSYIGNGQKVFVLDVPRYMTQCDGYTKASLLDTHNELYKLYNSFTPKSGVSLGSCNWEKQFFRVAYKTTALIDIRSNISGFAAQVANQSFNFNNWDEFWEKLPAMFAALKNDQIKRIEAQYTI